MKKAVKVKLARSLTAGDVRLLPYLPYLLQDLWNLGTPVKALTGILKRHIPDFKDFKILDLGCGKGAVGLPLAKETGARVHMADAFPQFIDYAQNAAREMRLTNCTFAVEDITRLAAKAKDYDMVLLCAVGNVFGGARQTVQTLKKTVRPGGYIVINDAHLNGGGGEMKAMYEYETLDAWLEAFKSEGCIILEHYDESGESCFEIDNEYNNMHIQKRAEELKKRYPQKAFLFDGYVKSRLDECSDIENNLSSAIWLLRTV